MAHVVKWKCWYPGCNHDLPCLGCTAAGHDKPPYNNPLAAGADDLDVEED